MTTQQRKKKPGLVCLERWEGGAHTRFVEARQVRPVAHRTGVTSDANPGRLGGNAVGEHKDLVPAGRADMCVRRSRNSAGTACTADRREDGALAVRVPVRAALGAHERDLEIYVDAISDRRHYGAAIRHILGAQPKLGPCRARCQIRGEEDLVTVLLGKPRVLGV